MGHDAGRAASALRLTLGRWTTREDIGHAAHQIAAAVLAAGPTARPLPLS
jgi:hypothetical protein